MNDQQEAAKPLLDPVELAQTMTQIAERSHGIVAQFLARQQEENHNSFGMSDPLNIGNAFLEMTKRLMVNPGKLMQAQVDLWSGYMQLWQNAAQRLMGIETPPLTEPSPDDRRFKDAAWQDNALFDFVKQSYLLTARWMQSTVRDVDGLDEGDAVGIADETGGGTHRFDHRFPAGGGMQLVGRGLTTGVLSARITSTQNIVAHLSDFDLPQAGAYQHDSWQGAYLVMAASMAVGVVTVLFSREPVQRALAPAKNLAEWLQTALIEPFADFFRRFGWNALLVLALIATYRVSDIVMGIMANPFYVDMGYSKDEVAAVSKVYGLAMTLIGAALGGVLAIKFGMMRTLMLGAILSAASNLLFSWLATLGHDQRVGRQIGQWQRAALAALPQRRHQAQRLLDHRGDLQCRLGLGVVEQAQVHPAGGDPFADVAGQAFHHRQARPRAAAAETVDQRQGELAAHAGRGGCWLARSHEQRRSRTDA